MTSPWGRFAPARVALQELAERVLDIAVRRAITVPADVHDAEQVCERALSSEGINWQVALGPILGSFVKRFSTRVLRVGSRWNLPVATLLAVLPALGRSVQLGARELYVLASLVVNRLREEGLDVDHRFVQRITVNTYLWPEMRRDVVRFQPSAVARLAAQWSTRQIAETVTSERPGGRVTKAAAYLAECDLAQLAADYRATLNEL